MAYNFAKRLKAIKGKTPWQFILNQWTAHPEYFILNPDHFFVGLNSYKKDYEGEFVYQHYVSQFLGFYIGGRVKKEKDDQTNRGIIGIDYTLPLLIKTDFRINTKGRVRFGLSNEHQLTDRTSFDWSWNTDREYTFGISYALTKQLYISGNYDSRERWGIGLNLKL